MKLSQWFCARAAISIFSELRYKPGDGFLDNKRIKSNNQSAKVLLHVRKISPRLTECWWWMLDFGLFFYILSVHCSLLKSLIHKVKLDPFFLMLIYGSRSLHKLHVSLFLYRFKSITMHFSAFISNSCEWFILMFILYILVFFTTFYSAGFWCDLIVRMNSEGHLLFDLSD